MCFDTGGISLKPAGGMEDMKWDMGGAGAVTGAMRLLAGRKARANVVGVCALVENMPDGNATRPGDVVKSMSGQTVEIINTDAEGRLILCDAMWYAQEKFKPQAMVELSTLTGAIIIALGHERAGLFSNNTPLSNKLRAAGAEIGEKLWRMPLGPKYDKLIDSEIADMRNVSNGRDGGSITAAQFLQRFVQDGRRLGASRHRRHGLVARATSTTPKGATAYGVRLLDRLDRRQLRAADGVMATEVNFYHLTRSSLEDALPRLLVKTLQAGERAVVMLGSPERVDALNTHLWTFDPNGFLPHGSAKDGEAERQPVWLTHLDENPNGAGFLFVADRAQLGESRPTTSAASNCSTAATRRPSPTSRERWKAYKAAGHAVVYWQQTPSGGWEKKA